MITFTYSFNACILSIYYILDVEDTTLKLVFQGKIWPSVSLYSNGELRPGFQEAFILMGRQARDRCINETVFNPTHLSGLGPLCLEFVEQGSVFLLSCPRLCGATVPSSED